MTALVHAWVAPDFAGPETGGTVYNACLVAALARLGVRARRIAREEAGAVAREARVHLWVDSLYLEDVPRLSELSPRTHLVAHYLPSLVRDPDLRTARGLSECERSALAGADRILATSCWFAARLRELGVAPDRLLVVEPGVVEAAPDRVPLRMIDDARPLRAAVVANVVPGKGVLELLRAFAPRARTMLVELTIIGSLDMAEAYASECVALVQGNPDLEGCVRFIGPIAHPSLAAALADMDVLVSASRMETFGMALLDARAWGIPIVARRGGNVEALVREEAGGCLTSSDEELVQALEQLASARDDLRSRSARARASRVVR